MEHCRVVVDKLIYVFEVSVVRGAFAEPFPIEVPLVLCGHVASDFCVIFGGYADGWWAAYGFGDEVMSR